MKFQCQGLSKSRLTKNTKLKILFSLRFLIDICLGLFVLIRVFSKGSKPKKGKKCNNWLSPFASGANIKGKGEHKWPLLVFWTYLVPFSLICLKHMVFASTSGKYFCEDDDRVKAPALTDNWGAYLRRRIEGRLFKATSEGKRKMLWYSRKQNTLTT